MNAPTKFETGRMTSKGQVLIPKALREAAGLTPNGTFKILVNDQNQVVIAPIGYGPDDAEERVQRMRTGLAALSGAGTSGMPTDEIMHALRGDWQP